jgi:hypothetical protein
METALKSRCVYEASVQRELNALAARNAELLAALKAAVKIADEARDEWDAAPAGMRAGKILIALSGRLKRYRADIDAIHAAIAKAEQLGAEGEKRT